MAGKVAFVFPGQGAQYPGMGRELAECSAAARRLFDDAERVMPGIKKLCLEGPAGELNQTLNAQPCLLVVGAMAAAALEEGGVRAEGVAGFSLGEMAAINYAGMLGFEDTLRLTMRRARHMQRCAMDTPGVMAAVLKLTCAQVEELAGGFSGVYPVNYNCPGQTVVAMAGDTLEGFTAAAKAGGGRVVPLKVSGAFHSPYMQNAARAFAEDMAGMDFAPPRIAVYANQTALPYANDAPGSLAGQMVSPVRWQKTIENMRGAGFTTFVETGAGQVLSGLIKRIDESLITLNVQDKAGLQNTLKALKEGA